MSTARDLRLRRKQRVRSKLRKHKTQRPRLAVHRSGRHIYAQVIDDSQGVTVAAASTIDKDLRGKLKGGADSAAASEVGKLVAERAKAAGITEVVFDRGGYLSWPHQSARRGGA